MDLTGSTASGSKGGPDRGSGLGNLGRYPAGKAASGTKGGPGSRGSGLGRKKAM